MSDSTNGKGDKRRPELVKGSFRKNYVKIFRDNTNSIQNLAKKYNVDLSQIMVKNVKNNY